MQKTLKRHGSPDAITTDGLRSYRAAMKDLGNEHKKEVGRWANNRVENSHLFFRRRERAMLRCRRMKKTLQKFALPRKQSLRPTTGGVIAVTSSRWEIDAAMSGVGRHSPSCSNENHPAR